MKALVSVSVAAVLAVSAAAEVITRDILPLQAQHAHSSSIVELPNGDMLAVWFQGSGERTADDVEVFGARLPAGSDTWSERFPMADEPGFPDCNPVIWLDRDGTLWLFWVTVRAHAWERAILRYKTSTDYLSEGPPVWDWQDIILLKPGEAFAEQLAERLRSLPGSGMWAEYALPYDRMLIEASQDKVKRQEGWMGRCIPLQLESGRILLPLYSDGFNVGLCAISDDGGQTWRASGPMVGYAGIQPALAQKQDGALVAYMRDSGDARRILRSTSSDDGETWSTAPATEMPNPGSSIAVTVLADGRWAMVYNDTPVNRATMVLALSDDEGDTWETVHHFGEPAWYAYPTVIQSAGGALHVSYTYKADGQTAIRHDRIEVTP